MKIVIIIRFKDSGGTKSIFRKLMPSAQNRFPTTEGGPVYDCVRGGRFTRPSIDLLEMDLSQALVQWFGEVGQRSPGLSLSESLDRSTISLKDKLSA